MKIVNCTMMTLFIWFLGLSTSYSMGSGSDVIIPGGCKAADSRFSNAGCEGLNRPSCVGRNVCLWEYPEQCLPTERAGLLSKCSSSKTSKSCRDDHFNNECVWKSPVSE